MIFWPDFIMMAVAATALYTDLKTGLIKNWLTIPFFFAGLAKAVFGGSGILPALMAGLAAIPATFIFLNPGEGDIKLAAGMGVWLGPGLLPVYFIGAGLARVVMALAVRLKVYDWNIIAMIKGTWISEIRLGCVPALGYKNFRIFQQAGKMAGADTDLPVVPGAIFVSGGALAVVLLHLYFCLTGGI
ncbi:MAG: A24 family peptidase [Moorella sp. (in: firmicutes)]